MKDRYMWLVVIPCCLVAFGFVRVLQDLPAVVAWLMRLAA